MGTRSRFPEMAVGIMTSGIAKRLHHIHDRQRRSILVTGDGQVVYCACAVRARGNIRMPRSNNKM